MLVRCLGITAIAAVLGLDAMGASAPQQRGAVARPAGQEDSSRQAGADLIMENGEPVLRFGAGHLHTTSGCYGYLYFAPKTIRYEVDFDGKDKGHSFQKPRSELGAAAESYWGSLELKFRRGGNYRFLPFPRDRIERQTLHGRVFQNSGILPSQPMILAANDFEAAVQQAGGTAGGVSLARSTDPSESLRRKPTDPPPTGLYQLESEISFNVLDSVVLDPGSGQITLLGHRDQRYAGPPIPYLQHLATLLENSRPSFTLNWTPESEKRVDKFLASTWSPADQQRWVEEWGTLLDVRGEITRAGRYMLPALGALPTRNGNAPGTLGATLQPPGGGTGLRIAAIARGSPAERAGLLPGDLMSEINGLEVLPLEQTLREIRYLGAGTGIEVLVLRAVGGSPQWLRATVTLGAAPGDPWQGVTRNDLAAAGFRAGGNSMAADATFWFGMLTKLNDDNPAYKPVFMRLLTALGVKPAWEEYGERVRQGQIAENDAKLMRLRAFASALDDAYRLTDRPVLRRVNNALLRVSDPILALGEALGEFDRHSKAAVGAALDSTWSRPGGILIPPELVESAVGVRPEVMPEYIGVDARSQLARTMFDADYLGKRLVNMPALAQKIPRYQTQVAFGHAHPQTRRSEATYRMWISVARMDVAQSVAGNTLETRGARMQFNLRELNAAGGNLPPESGSYGELLTSLYDDLALEFPVLHELREAAKLAAAAEWLKGRHPDLRLPAGGRSSWNGPSRLPGLIFIYLHQPTGGSRMNTTVIATGGVA